MKRSNDRSLGRDVNRCASSLASSNRLIAASRSPVTGGAAIGL
jgi:hypothetical protein